MKTAYGHCIIAGPEHGNELIVSTACAYILNDALKRDGPVRPVGAALAVHHIGLSQGPVGAQLGCAAVYEGAIAKDYLILVARRHTCMPKAFEGAS